MGSWRFTRNGERAPAMAGNPFGHCAKWLLHRISASGGGRAIRTAGVGMAGDVMGWRVSGVAGLLHPLPGERIAGLGAAPRAHGRSDPTDRERALEALRLSRAPDDPHDVPVAWYAGSLSALSSR